MDGSIKTVIEMVGGQICLEETLGFGNPKTKTLS